MTVQAKPRTLNTLDVADDPRLSKETKAFLKELNSAGVALETLTPLAARQVLVDAQTSVQVDLSGIDESEKTIVADGYTILLNIVRPAGIKDTLPVFMFIHGGGWVLGDYPTHKRMVRDLVVHSGFAAVFVNYTRTPDAQYPQAINEIYAATQWVAEHGEETLLDLVGERCQRSRQCRPTMTGMVGSFYRFLPFIATNGRRNLASERSEVAIAT